MRVLIFEILKMGYSMLVRSLVELMQLLPVTLLDL